MFQTFLVKTFQLLSRYATEPDDSEEWRIKKIIGITVAVLGTLLWAGYSLLYLSFDERSASLACLSGSVLWGLGLLSYGIFRRYTVHLTYWAVTLILPVTLVHLLLGGFVQSGMVMLWTLAPLLMSGLAGYKPHQSLMVFLFVTAIFIILLFLQPFYLRTSNNLPQNVISVLIVINTLLFASMVFLGMYYFMWQNEILSKLVLGEQEKSESLLLNILPKEIVAILKNENRVIADQFDSTSILFADVVNFTPMSAMMTPTELVGLLDEVYSYFDTLVEKYGLEKIKTIGDCYMVASGVPRRRSDHALVLTRLALDIRDYVSQHEFHGHKLSFRIGLNSGSVVAGVIGRKKFTYDLWGDAVNTASRMESHSAGGSIQVTEATYDLIKEEFVCDPRGTIQVKGKGEMPVWFVMEKR